LTLAIGTVEVNVIEHRVSVCDIETQAPPPGPPADLDRRTILHPLQKADRNVDQLVVNGVVIPDGPEHENPLVAGDVSEGMSDQGFGSPFTCLSCAEFGDAYAVPSGYAARFRLE
jgi:hypothetical protein